MAKPTLRAVLFAALALMLVSCTQYSGKTPPKVVEGVLDARDWDLSKDGPIDLRGDWEVLPEGVLFDEEVIAPQRSCCAPDIVGRGTHTPCYPSPLRVLGHGSPPGSGGTGIGWGCPRRTGSTAAVTVLALGRSRRSAASLFYGWRARSVLGVAMPLERLAERDDGCVEYAFRKPWRDGTRAVVLTAEDRLARLCAPWEKARRRVFT